MDKSIRVFLKSIIDRKIYMCKMTKKTLKTITFYGKIYKNILNVIGGNI